MEGDNMDMDVVTGSANTDANYFTNAKINVCGNVGIDEQSNDCTLFESLQEKRDALRDAIETAKVLVVGAGGIGCEVLKNLVLMNFQHIEIIDLDTIDVSNLNRQFLFRRCHVTKPKALIARETALEFNPNVNITAHHDTIFNAKYGVGYFNQFRLVINALDNRAARNHVNRMCLAAEVPLIESGTAGYHGQVEMILKGVTQCYECEPKPVQKTFPGCTIRNTPSEPVHCIVWAKHLFNQLFGEEDADNEVSPDSADPELLKTPSESNGKNGDGDVAGSTNGEAASKTHDGNVERKSTREWAHENDYSPSLLHTKFFVDDIKYLLSMSSLWQQRRAPIPSTVNIDTLNDEDGQEYSGLERTMKVWSERMCGKVFEKCCISLNERLKALPTGDFLTWDKDDEIAMDFVTACANIRSYIFGIPVKSKFDVKAIAGNIIPAIATTNAIIAAVVINQVLNILENQPEKNTTVHLRKYPNHNHELFMPEKQLIAPNKNCFVCAPKPQITLEIDVNKTTVHTFEESVLKQSLNVIAPDVFNPSKSEIVISSEEGETTANNSKTLIELGITDGCILIVDDFLQEYQLKIIMKHKERGREEAPFEIIGNRSELKPKETAGTTPAPEPVAGPSGISNINHDSDDDCLVVDYDESAATEDDLMIIEQTDISHTNSSSLEAEYRVPSKRMKLTDS